MLLMETSPDAGARTKSAADSEAIYRGLKSLIVQGGMEAGSRLPTERAVASRFRAARNTVRKTMQRLVDEGLVVRHVGRGTFVAEDLAPESNPRRDESNYELWELLEARLLFEPALAELVVERATEEELLALNTHLHAMNSAESWIDFKEAKYALHLAIARASKNPLVKDIFEMIVASRRRAGWGRPGRHGLMPVSALREAAAHESAAIVEALQRRDHLAARELIRANLLRTFVSISGS